jgi:hypothetical protein
MKHWRQHATLWGATWIPERKVCFQDVQIPFENFSVVRNVEPLDVVRKSINLWGHSCSSGYFNQRPTRQTVGNGLVIKEQPACAR